MYVFCLDCKCLICQRRGRVVSESASESVIHKAAAYPAAVPLDQCVKTLV